MITPAEISAYLGVVEHQDERLWSWKFNAEKGYWAATYTGCLPACDIHIEINGAGLCLAVDLGEQHVRPECRVAFQHFLLRLNDDLPIVKFGLGERGHVVLMAEALASQVSLNTFEELLQAVTAVFAQYHREIELLASSGELANLLAKTLGSEQGPEVSVVVVDQNSKRVSEQGAA